MTRVRPLSPLNTPSVRARKSTQILSGQSFSRTLRVMESAPQIVDFAPKSVCFLQPRWCGQTFYPWSPGCKGQECPQEIRTKKFMFMLFVLPWSWAMWEGAKSPCPPRGVQNIILGDPLHWPLLQVLLGLSKDESVVQFAPTDLRLPQRKSMLCTPKVWRFVKI